MSDIRIERRRDPDAVAVTLRSLPDWFGIEDAIQNYVASAARLESFLAIADGSAGNDRVVGVALVEPRYERSAELTLLAVHAEQRGCGIGTMLVNAVASELAARGIRLLEVHTVGPSFDNEPYAQTRAFYERVGFIPLHEFDGVDWDGPTLVLVMPLGESPLAAPPLTTPPRSA